MSEQPKYVTIESSWGEVHMDEAGGLVIDAYECDPGEVCWLHELARFDCVEWETHHKRKLVAGDVLDILDLGYWNKAGVYEPPAQDWRDMQNEMGGKHAQAK